VDKRFNPHSVIEPILFCFRLRVGCVFIPLVVADVRVEHKPDHQMNLIPPNLDSSSSTEATSAQGAPADDPKIRGNQASRKAILVIHGIGRQDRFQMLDRFVNGLRAAQRSTRVTHGLRGRGEVFEHFIRLDGDRALDIYEFYWAPLAVEKASFSAVASWIYETGFAPFRRLAFNLPLLIHRARENSRKPDKSLRVWLASGFGGTVGHDVSWPKFASLAVGHFLLELLRVAALLLLALAFSGIAAALVANASGLLVKLVKILSRVDPSSLEWHAYLTMLVFLGAVVAAAALLWSFPRQVRDLVRVCRISPSFVWRLDPFGKISFALAIPGILTQVSKDLLRKVIKRFQLARPAPELRTKELVQAEVPCPKPVENGVSFQPALGPECQASPAAQVSGPDAWKEVGDKLLKGIQAIGSLYWFVDTKFGLDIRTWSENRQNARRWRAEIAGRAVFLLLSALALFPLGWLAFRLFDPTQINVFGFRVSSVLPIVVTQLGDQGLRNIAWLLMLLLLGVFLKRAFVDYIADIALYTTASENSPFAKTRNDILNEATRGLRWLLRHYDCVAIAGHSLGSVIGYDAINRLKTEVQFTDELAEREAKIDPQGKEPLKTSLSDDHESAAPIDQKVQHTGGATLSTEQPISSEALGRLQTFITFGSPLNKVLYFFRTTVKDYETIRAHILTMLFGFRRPQELLTSDPEIQDGLAFGDNRKAMGALSPSTPLSSLFWLNVSCPLDPVSARLFFYEDVWEYRRWYLLPGLCHMSYWYDRRFYEEVLAALDKTAKRAKMRTGF